MGTANHYVGSASEHKVASYFLSQGHQVYWPSVQQDRADMVVDLPEGLRKVQVKIAREDSSKRNTYLRVRLEKPSRGSRPYAVGDFDILAVTYNGALWLIPYDELPAQKSLTVDKWGPTIRPLLTYNPDDWRVK